jgi:hypothetical protein
MKAQTSFKTGEIVKISTTPRSFDRYQIVDIKPYRGSIMITGKYVRFDETLSTIEEKFTLRENGYFIEKGCPMGYTSYHKLEFKNQ